MNVQINVETAVDLFCLVVNHRTTFCQNFIVRQDLGIISYNRIVKTVFVTEDISESSSETWMTTQIKRPLPDLCFAARHSDTCFSP